MSMKKTQTGFTLIEIMVAISIVSILSAVVMVQFTSYSKKARASKALAQISSALPSMYSCWGNGGIVLGPSSESGGNNICSIGDTYGKFPSLYTSSTDLSTYSYGLSNLSSSSSWFIRVISPPEDDNIAICCSSATNSCEITGDFTTMGTCN